MATSLFRLGRFAYRHGWAVIGVWLVLLIGILGGGFALGGQSQESFAIPGTESQNALDRLEAVFPQVAGASAQAILVAPEGSLITDPEYTDAIDELVEAIGDIDGIDSVVGPFDEYAASAVSEDETAARVQVQFDGQSSDVTESTLEELVATGSVADDAGLRVEYGGQVFQDNTFGITVSEALGVVFAGIVLLVTFGSLAAAGMPLLSALIGVGIVIGGITAVSAFTTVSSSAPLLALMIGLAVGIDYSLFILSRHRNQLARGEDPEVSAATSVGTAGGAVVFAGVTVIIALLGLLVVGIPFLSVMGVGAAFAVLVGIAVATTLLPAILGLAKGRLAPKHGSRAWRRAHAGHGEHGGGSAGAGAAVGDASASMTRAAAHAAPGSVTPADAQAPMDPTRTGTRASAVARAGGDHRALAVPATPAGRPMGLRWVGLVMKAPVFAALAVVAILGTLALPALSLDLNLPDNGSEPSGSTQRQAYDLVSEHFGPGYNGPLIVAVDITQTTEILEDLESIGDELRPLDDVAFVSQGAPDPGLDTAILQVIPGSAPDSAETKALVQNIRDLAPRLEEEYDTAISVTGATAVGIDISNRLTDALVPFGVIVVGLSVVLLMMVFRSILVPIKAALGFLLSVVASFGVVVAIFQWGWLGDLLNVENPGPILSFMPILLMAVLFGLAMDYEVFLVSGMREEFVRTGDARRAVYRGFGNGARVVTAAALIMFFVFFAFVPEGSGTIKPIALGLAVGIVFDAFLVRMTLVPALMTLLGRSAWALPRWLDRILPNVDIEGENLRGHLEATEWARVQGDAAISMDRLVAGSPDRRVGPVTFSVPRGSLVVIGGETADRRLFAATVGGRLEPLAGRAQVLGHPLPSEKAPVSRLVAVADLGPSEPTAHAGTVGELLTERLALTSSWFRAASTPRQGERWVDRIRAAMPDSARAGGDAPGGATGGAAVPFGATAGAAAPGGATAGAPEDEPGILRAIAGVAASPAVEPRTPVIEAATPIASLRPLERAIVLAGVALAEQAPVVVFDSAGSTMAREDEVAFLAAISQLAPSATTVLVGTSFASALVGGSVGVRPVMHLELGAAVVPDPAKGPDPVKGPESVKSPDPVKGIGR